MGIGRVAALAAVVLLGLVAGCSRDDDAEAVTIGVVDAADSYWSVFRSLAANEGIEVSVVGFGDYVQPNAALQDGDLDMNLYQGLAFLAAYNHSAGTDLTPIGATAIYPLPLYSKRHRTVADIPPGATIVVPDDPTNIDRALRLLSEAGLVSVRAPAALPVGTEDVDRARSKVTVRTVDAYQTAIALDSADGAVVHITPARNAGLRKEWILAREDPQSDASLKYVNAFVVRADDRDNPTFRKLAELFHAPEVLRAFAEDKGPDASVVRRPPEQLRTLERSLRAQMRP